MPISSELDSRLVEQIISKAKEYARMPNALTVDAAFGRAATDFLGANHGAWGQYKKTAKGIFLNREKEAKEARHKELLRRGAQEAAWARGDADVEEAEVNEEELSRLRDGRK